MAVVPRDISDLYLAPLTLTLDARIEDLSRLALDELYKRVALVSDRPDWSRELREEALLRTLTQAIETHDWTLSWHARGVEVHHGDRRVVLGVPETFTDYLDGKHR